SSLRFGSEILGELRDLKAQKKFESAGAEDQQSKTSFMDHLKNAVEEVNQSQLSSDKKATDLANGKDTNIHETMLAASQAELSFNLMVQVRNKALEAYQEVMRMPV
ncbi:MAG: flagellar hook-basal body complex protein FliE, partial [Pseudobdellovibrionaceae bacterium]|nr:flagellar hook-basal body complex protein FliE [Pseudobdellovibrionaceae bacterium]